MAPSLALVILEILTTALPDGVVGQTYHFRLQAQGGTPPYVWNVEEGTLPPGLKLGEKTGEIAGRPARTARGEARFVVVLTDSGGESHRMALRLRVAEPIRLLTPALPAGFAGAPYQMQLRTYGGMGPYLWEVAAGALPAGLKLDRETGLLSGTPSAGGDYAFSLRISDSAGPPQREVFSFAVRLVVPLAVRWQGPPHVERGGVFGSLQASNGTSDDFDLTVIVVAVNEYGKAFALGHHHFILKRESFSNDLRFGFTLPRGLYTVHADAVAEVAPRSAIFRARLESRGLGISD